jgi:hypothetical protein
MKIPVTKLIPIREALELLQSRPTKGLIRDRSRYPNATLNNLPKKWEGLGYLHAVKLRVHPPGDRGEFQQPPGSTPNLGEQVAALDTFHHHAWSSVPLNSFERGRDEWKGGVDRLEDDHLSVCSIAIAGLSVEAEHCVGTPTQDLSLSPLRQLYRPCLHAGRMAPREPAIQIGCDGTGACVLANQQLPFSALSSLSPRYPSHESFRTPRSHGKR